jgi:hypothetical protein
LDLALCFANDAAETERTDIKLDLIDAVTAAPGALGERLAIAEFDSANSTIGFRAVRDGVVVFECSRAARVNLVARVCARAAADAYYRVRNERIARTRLAALRESQR